MSHSSSKCRTVTVSVAQLQQVSHSYSKCRLVLFIEQNNEVSKLLRKFLNELSTVGHTVKMFQFYGGISDSVETVYQLLLLPKYTASGTFVYKIGSAAKC